MEEDRSVPEGTDCMEAAKSFIGRFEGHKPRRSRQNPSRGCRGKHCKRISRWTVGFIEWLGVWMMQKQGHRGIIDDGLVIGQNVRPEHALHTRRSLRNESFVHVCKLDSVDTITAKTLTVQ